jgi:asparagine synthase (glutamine-hydrolysing)
MCGLAGILRNIPPSDAIHRRDAAFLDASLASMTNRGPDGEGLDTFASPACHATLAHRRLAVVAPGPEGRQPMTSPCGRWSLVYNGELYNDAELRRDLSARWPFRTAADTETVLAAVATWGLDAAHRLRGMYALALLDTHTGTLTLARDPLGIKPFFFAERRTPEGPALAFASLPRDLAAWASGGTPRPDPAALANYLVSIRTTLGPRTMFAGVSTLRPGEWIRRTADRVLESRRVEPSEVVSSGGEADTHDLRHVIEDSVRRHLRADVPLCALLSGGLDSTILAALARRDLGTLHTFCAGAPGGEDFAHARDAARHLATTHTEVPLDRALFARRVPEMIAALGVPLSTPNEVAIHEVARAMRSQGMVVTLSGEGADELFAGYDRVLAAAASHEAAGCPSADFWTESHAWIPSLALARVLAPEAFAAAADAEPVRDAVRNELAAIEPALVGTETPAVERHLRYQRRVNLEGLLRRLDTATMLAGVEGQTPFADAVVAAAAERLPTSRKIRLHTSADHAAPPAPPTWSKIALREAFADVVPAAILARPKASFPLPFESWSADLMPRVRESRFLADVIRPEILDTVAADPAPHWRLAWPLANLACWGETLIGGNQDPHVETCRDERHHLHVVQSLHQSE